MPGKRKRLSNRCSLASDLSADGDSRMAEMTRRKCAFCPYNEPCAIMYVSEEQNLTVHQNCLLFSSGFVELAEENPEDGDKRFDVTSVRNEIKRGRRLYCSHCQKTGATIGCEVKTCRKSYHYFCALRDGASMETNEEQGYYHLFCSNHKAKRSHADDEDRENRMSPFIPKSSSTTTRMVTPMEAVITRRKCAFCPDDEPCAIIYIFEEQNLTVHQNCLLFSLGFVKLAEKIPEDLKRFDMDLVRNEINRGRTLLCDGCQKRGATIECKIKTCDSSFHYFCALRDGASMETDKERWLYRMCCSNHIPANRPLIDDDEDRENEQLFVPGTSSTTTRMNDETVGEENMELVSENHDQPRERIEFLKKCKQAGFLNGIFEKMLNTLRQAQEKLMDDNISEAEYEETVTLLFDCGFFENIRREALSVTEGKIEELMNTRNRLDAEIESFKENFLA